MLPKFDNFLVHFKQINLKKNKISKCKSLIRKIKKGYGCTKETKVLDIAGWRWCGK